MHISNQANEYNQTAVGGCKRVCGMLSGVLQFFFIVFFFPLDKGFKVERAGMRTRQLEKNVSHTVNMVARRGSGPPGRKPTMSDPRTVSSPCVTSHALDTRLS